ncbi:polysaccharide deacetylase [Xanthomonas translucens pv. poae]|uniref:Polysaccharide deacetylase n=2 Tax=Xanthomonas translucens group TaxID=3390202 RepID=A0A0K2ZGB9_9XANT|nr:polysaccharide deacetylase family protein [Xanthomonas translucens]UKE61185.1 polysaccharide deacetylase family protein [Xanthomonas translucens pv. poae]CTP84007.1 polysaccharide deacetylase [Xanthomonas translucens pv. poae]
MHSATSPAAARIPIFMYHNIAQAPRQLQVYRSLYVAPARFARQMRLLRRLGYRGVSMSDAMPYLRGERHGRIAVLTLDDGYLDNLHAALPVLQGLGFSATVYAVSGSIGRHNTWDADKLGIEKPLMSLAELRQWQRSGMEVGAHTRSHPRLTACSDAVLREEIGGCKRALEDLLGAAVTQFCYPYGDVNARVTATVQEAGYIAATTTRRGRAVPGSDPWRYPRIQVARHHLLPQFALRALTGYEDRRA